MVAVAVRGSHQLTALIPGILRLTSRLEVDQRRLHVVAAADESYWCPRSTPLRHFTHPRLQPVRMG
jgi:hypothetical protein